MQISIGLVALSITAILQIAGAATVTVDFANDKGPMDYRASGFLHSYTATQPGPDRLEVLKPKLWRTNRRMCDKAAYDRSVAMGTTVQLVISDSYGYNNWPGSASEWAAYENWVTNWVNANRAAGIHVQYDVWNEPDGMHIGTAFYHAYRAIKAIDSTIQIAAPSTWTGAGAVLNFLRDIEQYGVYPDYICLHCNSYDTQPERDVQAVRDYIQQNNLPIKGIQINEYISDPEHWNAFWHCKYLSEIDRVGVAGASLACWNTCWDPWLDGLLRRDGPEDRLSTWFVHKAYADISGRRAGITRSSSGASFDGIMGFDSEKRELRGVFAPGGTVNLTNLSATGFLQSSGTVDVEVQRIQNSGGEVSSGPVQILSDSRQYSNDQLSIDVSVSSMDAFILIVRGDPTGTETQAHNRGARPPSRIQTDAGRIELTAPAGGRMTVIDARGVVRHSQTVVTGQQVAVGALAAGMYQVKYNATVSKIVVNP